VCLAHHEEANKAVVELNGRLWDTKLIYVTIAQKKEFETRKGEMVFFSLLV